MTEEQREKARARTRAFKARHRERVLAEGRAYAKARYLNEPEHAERQREKSRRYRQENAENMKEIRRRCYVKHAEKRRAESRAYYRANREKCLLWAGVYWRSLTDQQRERLNRMRLDRKKRNLDAWRHRVANASSRRRARVRSAAVVEHVDRLLVLARDEGVCHICEGHVDPGDFHIDHIVPLARGGDHSYDNVAVSHPVCNLRKGTKTRQETP